jgi:hypothetical protein
VTTHLVLLVIFSVLVSAVLAALTRDDPRAQVRTGLKMVGAFVGAAILLGWLMYPLPL